MKKDVTDLGLSIYWRHSRGKKRKGGKKPPRKEIVYRVFPDVNRIGRPNAVTSIPILLGHYKQLHKGTIPYGWFPRVEGVVSNWNLRFEDFFRFKYTQNIQYVVKTICALFFITKKN